MPTFSIDKPAGHYVDLSRKRNEYRGKLIAKGVVNGSTKMLKLMHRKGL